MKTKRNPKGAGRKPSGVAKYHTTVRVDIDLYQYIKSRGWELGATINEALKRYIDDIR